MIGFLFKDCYLLKTLGRSFLSILALFLLLTVAGVYPVTTFSSIAVLLLTMLPLSTFSLDEAARWERFAAITPAGRRGVVAAKYLFTLGMTGISLFLTVLVNLFIFILRPGENTIGILSLTSLVCTCMGMLMAGILLPLTFWQGAQKSRIFLAVIMGGVFSLLMLGLFLFQQQGIQPYAFPSIVFLFLGLGPIFFAFSYPVSRRIYAKRAL